MKSTIFQCAFARSNKFRLDESDPDWEITKTPFTSQSVYLGYTNKTKERTYEVNFLSKTLRSDDCLTQKETFKHRVRT